MCPEDSLLSSYVDQEIPEPWQGRIRSHLDRCPRCTAKVTALRSLSAGLARIENSHETEALQQASLRIAQSLPLGTTKISRTSGSFLPWLGDLLNRKFTIPAPALALGALAVLLIVGVSLGVFAPLSRNASLLASLSKVIASNQTSIETLTQSMKQGGYQPVMIEAPSGYIFEQQGEPVIFTSGALIQDQPNATYGEASK